MEFAVLSITIFILAFSVWVAGSSICKLIDEQNFILKDIADILENWENKN